MGAKRVKIPDGLEIQQRHTGFTDLIPLVDKPVVQVDLLQHFIRKLVEGVETVPAVRFSYACQYQDNQKSIHFLTFRGNFEHLEVQLPWRSGLGSNRARCSSEAWLSLRPDCMRSSSFWRRFSRSYHAAGKPSWGSSWNISIDLR